MEKDIILITTDFSQSGVYRIEGLLLNEWEKKGCTISILSPHGRIIKESKRIINPQNRGQETNNIAIIIITRIIRLIRFMNIHKNATVVALNLPACCFASILGLFVKNKIVISERNSPAHYPESRIYREFRNLCFRFADVCIFQTEEAKQYFPRSVQNKGFVIPNPINDRIPNFMNIRKENKIVSAGRLRSQKNYPMLINAFAKFSKLFTNYTLEIYGDGPLKSELIHLINEMHLEDKVTIHEFCNDIFPIMAEASMFIMSSNYEGISNSMLEAMAIGTPTICTDCPVGGAREMIQNNINGLLVPVGDENALCDAMCKVADDAEFASILGKNAALIREKYPVGKIANEWLKLF